MHIFDHYEERLIKVIKKKGDITDYKQFFNDVRKIMSRGFCKKWWKLNIFPYLIDFLPFLLQVLSLYVYAILLKEFRHSMVLGKSNTKVSEKYCRAPVIQCLEFIFVSFFILYYFFLSMLYLVSHVYHFTNFTSSILRKYQSIYSILSSFFTQFKCLHSFLSNMNNFILS